MLFSVFLVSLGAILLSLSAVSILKIYHLLGENRSTAIYWRVLFILTLFFVVGYIGAKVLIVMQFFSFLIYIVGLVFFFGALFVFLVTRIGLKSIGDMELEVQERVKDMRVAQAIAEKANRAKSDFLSIMSHENSYSFDFYYRYSRYFKGYRGKF